MVSATENGCPRCGREVRAGQLCCGLCGLLLARDVPGADRVSRGVACADPVDLANPVGPAGPARWRSPVRAPAPAEPRLLGLPAPGFYLVLGAVLAPVFLLPLPAWIGWYFSALVHEMGHAATAWALGCPALPALGLGEAVTVEAARVLPLALVIWAALCTLAWRGLDGAQRWVALGTAGALYPLVAFSGLGELAKLVAGHAAELGFAALALWRGMSGGFTSSAAERGLYAVLGWYLLGDNLRLGAALMTSPAARAEYASNGSFGCVNDYIRVADGWLGGSLEGVALCATLAALAVLPLALFARRLLPAR